MENVQKVIVPGYGQTSDREISVVEKKYFELPKDFPEIPAGYKQWKQKKKLIVFVIFLHMRITYML